MENNKQGDPHEVVAGQKGKYGNITVGVGTGQMRDLEITDFVQAAYEDNRVVTISEIEDGTMCAMVENIGSSGRAPQANIWLSKESFIAVLSTAFIYFDLKGEDIKPLFESIAKNEGIEYRCSDNLKNSFKAKTNKNK